MGEAPERPKEFKFSRRAITAIALALIATAVLAWSVDPDDQEDGP
jgi:hypothetical protein